MPHGTRMEKTMRAEIITIGDELLIGQVVDTNSAWMAEKLNEMGIEVYQIRYHPYHRRIRTHQR